MSAGAELWGLLPLAAYAGLFAGQVARGWTVVVALLRAAIFWAAGAWVLANALGWFGALRPAPLRGAWLLLAALALADGWRARRGRWTWPCPQGVGEWTAAGAIGTLWLLALVIAVVAPPVTVDVLNYHLPRQLMWLQQGSLAHFVTVNDRELMMPPLAEVIGLHFLALTGDDHWANLPQWAAYVLLPVAVAQTVRTLGASRATAWLAAWLVVCLPMAWLEASNGKNDLQGALWLALLLWQVASARRQDLKPGGSGNATSPRAAACLAGVTLALSLLTKSTALIYAPPLLAAGWLAWRQHWGAAGAWRATALAAFVAVVLSAPFFARNLAWYGTPLGVHRAEEGGDQTNDALTPALVASNALRNAAIHLSGPWPQWNATLDRAVRTAHAWLGLSVDDPRNTLWVTKFAVLYGPREETKAGAPWHFVLICGVFLGGWGWRGAAGWRWLAVVTASMALITCASLKWQPWGARLELPVFATGSLLAAGVIGALPPLVRCLAAWGAGALGLLVWWPSHNISARPLQSSPALWAVSRDANRYRYYPELQERDAALTRLVHDAGVHEVAVVSLHDIAYPLMRQLGAGCPGCVFMARLPLISPMSPNRCWCSA